MATELEVNFTGNLAAKAKKAGASLQGLVSETDKLKSSAKVGGSALDSMGSRGSGAFAKLGGSMAAVAGPAAAVAIGVAAITVGLGLAIKAAASFGSAIAKGFDTARTIKGVATILGKGVPGAADKALDAILDIQRKTAAPLEEITESFNLLSQGGFSSKDATAIATITMNLQAAGKEGQLFRDKLRDLKKEFELTGDISDTILEDLSEQLGGSKVFMEALSKATGKSVKELKKLQADKKLKDLPGIQEAITKTAIKLGKEFDGLSKASKPLAERLQSIADVAFTEIGRGIKLDFIGDLFKLLESDDAKTFFQAFGKGLNMAVGVLKKFGKGFLKAFGPAIPELKKLGTAVLKAFGFMDKDAVASIGSLAGTLGGMVAKWVVHGARMAAGAALVVAAFVQMGIKISGVAGNTIDTIAQMRDTVAASLQTLAATAQQLGLAVSQGLAGGIMSGIGLVSAAAGALANAVKSAVAGATGLKIQSPSKVFQGYGDMTAVGFARGVEGGGKGVQKATKGTFSPDAMQRSIAGSSALGGGGGGGNTFGDIIVNVDGSGGGDLADMIALRISEVLQTTATA